MSKLRLLLFIFLLSFIYTGCTAALSEEKNVSENHLDVEMSQNYGIMYSPLSQLDEVTYPFIAK